MLTYSTWIFGTFGVVGFFCLFFSSFFFYWLPFLLSQTTFKFSLCGLTTTLRWQTPLLMGLLRNSFAAITINRHRNKKKEPKGTLSHQNPSPGKQLGYCKTPWSYQFLISFRSASTRYSLAYAFGALSSSWLWQNSGKMTQNIGSYVNSILISIKWLPTFRKY